MFLEAKVFPAFRANQDPLDLPVLLVHPERPSPWQSHQVAGMVFQDQLGHLVPWEHPECQVNELVFTEFPLYNMLTRREGSCWRSRPRGRSRDAWNGRTSRGAGTVRSRGSSRKTWGERKAREAGKETDA